MVDTTRQIDLGGDDLIVRNLFTGATTPGQAGTQVSGVGGTITLAAGTTLVAPLTMTAGTNLTTAAAGVSEFDGKVFYDTPVASTRELRRDEMFSYANVITTLSNSSTG